MGTVKLNTRKPRGVRADPRLSKLPDDPGDVGLGSGAGLLGVGRRMIRGAPRLLLSQGGRSAHPSVKQLDDAERSVSGDDGGEPRQAEQQPILVNAERSRKPLPVG